jgi:hypothetical protein
MILPILNRQIPQLLNSLLERGILLLAVLTAVNLPAAFAEDMKASTMNASMPQKVGGWTLSGPAKRVEPKAIFDYMDGAGELYLGYRFKYLDVYEYLKPGQSDMLVELYWMESSDDAYGLLSGDWGGEAVDLAPARGRSDTSGVRALYGAGLLRIWSGDLYARVLVYQETDASKQAVLAMGKAIVTGRAETKTPQLIGAMPEAVGPQFSLKSNRTAYLRSHLVLNSAYFLSSDNLLDLGLDCEMAAAVYQSSAGADKKKLVHVLLVRYPGEAAARKALAHFQKLYLAGKPFAAADRGVVPIEDGWTGFILTGKGLGLVFEAPDETTTRLFLQSSEQVLRNVEALHE